MTDIDEKVSAIEDAIAAGQMTAAQVFTQMRQLIAAQAAELARVNTELHDQRWQHAQELKRADQAERERDALLDELRIEKAAHSILQRHRWDELDEAESKLDALRSAVLRMHAAEKSYGTGFYSDPEWNEAYEETATLTGAF